MFSLHPILEDKLTSGPYVVYSVVFTLIKFALHIRWHFVLHLEIKTTDHAMGARGSNLLSGMQ